ncbi:MAG: hypothetical protein Q4Q21_07120 [Lachnospiraceae bacterium]|nr:hypothetical protein [Lachnospiraceae bacterium]
MDEKNGLGNQERMENLLHEISTLNKENQRLRKLLEDNGIILKEKPVNQWIQIRVPESWR